MNQVNLMGRLVRDPEQRATNSGTAVASFTVAVDRGDKDKNTDFIACQAWSKTAELLCKYFSKGSPIAVSGRIQTRSYEDKNGNKRNVTEVVCDRLYFVPKDKKQDAAPATQDTTPADGFAEISDDEDLPF